MCMSGEHLTLLRNTDFKYNFSFIIYNVVEDRNSCFMCFFFPTFSKVRVSSNNTEILLII